MPLRGAHEARRLGGNVAIDAVETLGLTTGVCVVVAYLAFVIRRAHIDDHPDVVPAIALIAVLPGAMIGGGLRQIWDSQAPTLGKLFGTVWIASSCLALRGWRALFTDASQRPGGTATFLDRALGRSL